jgi:hypothetical protein
LKQNDQSRYPPEERLVGQGPIVDLTLTCHSPPLFVDHCFSHLALQLGSDSSRVVVELASALDWPQLDARYVLVERQALAQDPRRGWLPLGGTYADKLVLGPETVNNLLAGTTTPPESAQVMLCAYETYLSITGCGAEPVEIRVSIGDMLTAEEALGRPAAQAA